MCVLAYCVNVEIHCLKQDNELLINFSYWILKSF